MHEVVLPPLVALHVLPEEAEAHLLGEDAGVDLVVVAGGEQRGEEDALQLGLREVVDGQVAQLLQDRGLVARLHDRLVIGPEGREVSDENDDQMEELPLLLVVLAVPQQVTETSVLIQLYSESLWLQGQAMKQIYLRWAVSNL